MSNLWISIMHPEWLTSVSPCLLAFLLPPHIVPVLFWQTISLKITQALYSWADWYSQEFCWHIHMHINLLIISYINKYICIPISVSVFVFITKRSPLFSVQMSSAFILCSDAMFLLIRYCFLTVIPNSFSQIWSAQWNGEHIDSGVQTQGLGSNRHSAA